MRRLITGRGEKVEEKVEMASKDIAAPCFPSLSRELTGEESKKTKTKQTKTDRSEHRRGHLLLVHEQPSSFTGSCCSSVRRDQTQWREQPYSRFTGGIQ